MVADRLHPLQPNGGMVVADSPFSPTVDNPVFNHPYPSFLSFDFNARKDDIEGSRT